jgi:transposase-like protein
MKTVNYGYNESQPQAETINKGGRMTSEQSNELKALAYQLYLQKINQKSIGKMIGVTEKTVGKWAREWKQSQNINTETIANLKARLLKLTADPMTPIADIKSLVWIIQQVETTQKGSICIKRSPQEQ